MQGKKVNLFKTNHACPLIEECGKPQEKHNS